MRIKINLKTIEPDPFRRLVLSYLIVLVIVVLAVIKGKVKIGRQ